MGLISWFKKPEAEKEVVKPIIVFSPKDLEYDRDLIPINLAAGRAAFESLMNGKFRDSEGRLSISGIFKDGFAQGYQTALAEAERGK